MLLRNLHLVSGGTADILTRDDKIEAVQEGITDVERQFSLEFKNAIVFPGLINSHDHLDFNLFPQLGNKQYSNYVEWSEDIHHADKDEINRVLKIPKDLRVKWGIYKNLLSGVTTVVNHGENLSVDSDLISVYQRCHSLHSVKFEKYWKLKLNKPFRNKWPYGIHVGEGTDFQSRREIDTLIRWNFCRRDIVGIHGIAMNEDQAPHFRALVWCPVSNYFLTGRTARINKLKHLTEVVFGTDSTLSAGWNIWEHLRLARGEGVVSDVELYQMLNAAPAKVWQIGQSGKLQSSFDADIVIARSKQPAGGFNAFYALDPADILMVMHKGAIRLFDEDLLSQISVDPDLLKRFSRVNINGCEKYVYGDVAGLMKQIRSHYPGISWPF